ncbi:MAG: hypothetical protein GF355_16880, partial [Candidatus Eisenbacteria bacterium]|nr:hypothetical protein [Candidatus Eisenbacteria bacterium]
MNYEFRIQEETLRVQLEREGDGLRAQVGEESFRVVARPIRPGTMALLFG